MNRTAYLLLASTIIVVGSAGPAVADDGHARDEPPRVCWAATDSDSITCYADEEAWKDAVLDTTGRVVLEEGESARGLLATYVISRLYQDAGYAGNTYVITATSSTFCASSSKSANLPSFDNVASSFHSYYGCTTHLYENTGQGGASISGGDVSALGTMNDKASSYTVN